jgi:hypothetical protein
MSKTELASVVTGIMSAIAAGGSWKAAYTLQQAEAAQAGRTLSEEYSSRIMPQFSLVRELCRRHTQSDCESPADIARFAVFYADNRFAKKEEGSRWWPLSMTNPDSTADICEAANKLRRDSVNYFENLQRYEKAHGANFMSYPAKFEREDAFATFVGFLYAANKTSGHQNFHDDIDVYSLPSVFQHFCGGKWSTHMETIRKEIKFARQRQQ